MNKLHLMCFVLGVGMSAKAATLDFSTCDRLYSMRGANLLPAAECYRAMLKLAEPSEQKTVFERAFIALSAAVNDGPKTQAEADGITKGLELVGELEKRAPGTAELAYWRAVFVSFDAMKKDRGSVLPKNLFAVLKSLQQDLKSAISLDPTIHLYGPSRVLGIMHTQMPGIVGGDKSLAEKLLSDAYTQAPKLSANRIAYARILIVNGKDEQAKTVLNRLLTDTEEALDPYPGEALRSVKPELERDRKLAKSLLDELNSDE